MKVLVPAFTIVEPEIITDTQPGLGNRIVRFQIHLFVFQAAPQALHEHIVYPAALAGLSIQQSVQCFFNRALDHLIQMTADLTLINPDTLAQPFRGIAFHGGPLWSVLWFGDYSFNRPGPPPPKNVRKIIYVIAGTVPPVS